MAKKSVTAWLYFYCESLICLCNPRSADVFGEKIFSFDNKGRKISLCRINDMATVGYYLNELKKTCVLIIKYRIFENMSNEEIAKKLNIKQHKKKYHADMIETIYQENIYKLHKKLKKAKMISV